MYNYLTLTRIAGGFLFRSAHISVGKYSLELNRLKPIKKKRQTDWSKCQSVCRFFIKIRVLGINQFIQNNLIGPVPNVVHPGNPFHLVVCFQFLGKVLLLGQLRNVSLFRLLRLVVNFFQMEIQGSLYLILSSEKHLCRVFFQVTSISMRCHLLDV